MKKICNLVGLASRLYYLQFMIFMWLWTEAQYSRLDWMILLQAAADDAQVPLQETKYAVGPLDRVTG